MGCGRSKVQPKTSIVSTTIAYPSVRNESPPSSNENSSTDLGHPNKTSLLRRDTTDLFPSTITKTAKTNAWTSSNARQNISDSIGDLGYFSGFITTDEHTNRSSQVKSSWDDSSRGTGITLRGSGWSDHQDESIKTPSITEISLADSTGMRMTRYSSGSVHHDEDRSSAESPSHSDLGIFAKLLNSSGIGLSGLVNGDGSIHIHESAVEIEDLMKDIYDNAAAHIQFIQTKNEEERKNQLEVEDGVPNLSLRFKLERRKERRELASSQGSRTAFMRTSGPRSKGSLSTTVEQHTNMIEEETHEEPEMSQTTTKSRAEKLRSTMPDPTWTRPNSRSSERGSVMDKHEFIMSEAEPLPSIPETSKETIYRDEDNIELFKDLEDFAVNLEEISSQNPSFATLMELLLIDELSDLEKVRMLFHWVTKQDLNSTIFPYDIEEDTPMGFLLAIKNKEKSYATLFSRLCSAAGLHSRAIRGHVKGVGYLPDTKFTQGQYRGAWNAVFIDEQWRLIDTNWGARYVVERNGDGDDKDESDSEETTVYRYEEHYFLTNPDQLIVTHFPDDPAWQLLREPKSLEQFQNTVRLWPLHYKMGLTLESPRSGVVVTSSDGIAEFRFRTTKFTRQDAKLKCELKTKSKKRKIGDTSLNLYTFHYRENEFEVFRVFCPAVGEYLLRISGNSKMFCKEGSFTNIALFQINCPKLTSRQMKVSDPLNVKPREVIAPFPQAYKRWGLCPYHNEVQMRPLSHIGPIVTCNKAGEATLVLEIFGERVPKFLQKVFTADGKQNDEKEPIPNQAVRFTTVSKTGMKLAVFRVRTPQKGIYSLVLSTDRPTDDKFWFFCNYLVVSHAQSNPSPPFPFVPNGRLGEDSNQCHQLGLSPTIYPRNDIKIVSNCRATVGNAWINGESEGYVSFNHEDPLSITVKLKTTNGTDFPGNVLVQDTGKKALVVVRPPQKNQDMFELGLTVYAATTTAANPGLPTILNTFVSCGKDGANRWLPKSPIGRWGPSRATNTGMSLLSVTNTTPLFSKVCRQDEADPSPCRSFTGGELIEVKFACERHFELKADLTSYDESGNKKELGDGVAFISKYSDGVCEAQVAIPSPGFYNFTLYGAYDENDERLWAVYYMLIHAKAATTISALPTGYTLWASNICQLISPVTRTLRRNMENSIKVKLAKFVDGEEPELFPKVLLFTDQRRSVEPDYTEPSSYFYEWNYIPGPDEKKLHLSVKSDLESNTVNYVLQFVVDD